MGNELVPYKDNCLNFDSEPNPKAEVTRSPFTESRCGRTRKQRRARPNVWKILISEVSYLKVLKLRRTSMTAMKTKKLWCGHSLNLNKHFLRLLIKAPTWAMEHFPEDWNLDNFDSWQFFVLCYLRHCKGKSDDPYPGNLFYLEERILRKWGKGRWVKYKKITSFSSLHFSKSGTVKFSPMRQVRSTWQNVCISRGKI